jgi:hypothetical protein
MKLHVFDCLVQHSARCSCILISMFLFLLNSLNQLQAERDEIFAKFEGSIYDVQQKCGLTSMLLQRKVQLLEEKLEKKVIYSEH